MPNNKYLQRLYRLSARVDDDIATAIDSVLMGLEDHEPITDAHWGHILLRCALMRRQLDSIEKTVLKAREQPSLSWQYEE